MRLKKILVLVIVLAVLVPVYSLTEAEAPTPGSIEDPIITKGYFDKNALSEEKVKQLIASAITAQPSSNGNSSNGSAIGGFGTVAITIVQLKSGQTLYAGEGTEIIIRTGKTVAVSNDENGIPDVTSGKDISAGSAIETNHLLIFPREGRGIKPDVKSTTDIFVMVRGGYLILNADGSKITP